MPDDPTDDPSSPMRKTSAWSPAPCLALSSSRPSDAPHAPRAARARTPRSPCRVSSRASCILRTGMGALLLRRPQSVLPLRRRSAVYLAKLRAWRDVLRSSRSRSTMRRISGTNSKDQATTPTSPTWRSRQFFECNACARVTQGRRAALLLDNPDLVGSCVKWRCRVGGLPGYPPWTGRQVLQCFRGYRTAFAAVGARGLC